MVGACAGHGGAHGEGRARCRSVGREQSGNNKYPGQTNQPWRGRSGPAEVTLGMSFEAGV